MRPFMNAALAAAYIAGVVFVMNTMMSRGSEGDGDNIIVLPMAMLSLFVLSAAVMGYLFVFEPLRLYLDGKKDEAAPFFLKTVAGFACFVAFFFAVYLSIVG